MIIIGAGMSGLLCGALNPGSVIYEAGAERESDHKAVFRCKSDQIGKILGIPFKKVIVHKGLWDNGHIEPSIRSAHMYSQKVTGKITGRSIFDLDSGVRYIPPVDFIEQLKARCEVVYNYEIDAPESFSEPIISTIPMQDIISLTRMKPILGFDRNPIFVNKIIIPDCDSYCTIYYPHKSINTYRASLNGSALIIESMEPESLSVDELNIVCNSMGLPWEGRGWTIQDHKQDLGKIYPIDEKLRKQYITNLTLKHNIYSLGRFATWRPKVMLDDVLEDIFVIKRLIEGGNYAALQHKQGENQ